MAIIKVNEARKMTKQERESKIQELKFELVKSNVTAQKSKAKTKEIKRTIARLYTMNNITNQEVAKK